MAESIDRAKEAPPEGPSRRMLLGLTGLVAGLVGALVAAPIVPFFAAPLLRPGGKGTWIPVGPADQFGEDPTPAEYTFEQQDGWYAATKTRRVVVTHRGGEFVVFSTQCTHLGCGVTWQPERQKFFCPCHSGEFNADGSVAGGPPQTPLTRLEAHVNAKTGQLEVKET